MKLRSFKTSIVRPDEIDALGHLNVRYYIERARAGADVLLDELGLGGDALRRLGVRLVQRDMYVKYQREQFEGAELVVRGGVLAADDEAVRLYFELDNDAKGETAASFIMQLGLADQATWSERPLPCASVSGAAGQLVEIPPHGRPRTIDLSQPRLDLSFDEMAERLPEEGGDPMSRQMVRTIEAESCDANGFLSEREDFMFGQVRSVPKDDEQWGPMTFKTDEGHRFGWAALEHRMMRFEQPRLGDVICSLGAEIGLHDKVRHSRRWIFNQTTGRVVAINDNVAIALDLDARRPIPIPKNIRSQLDKRHLPEFA